ncbi:competence protein CoiA family protein [Cytobacillus gottheilii]|uniref:competence protein CoiA family protein n=1 Tax=Cytobacillus gottheilii TaxID=859144 RepID=UPI0024951329|nr:competence protein CoiA family protein [Cytobacillus gottheilii]
MAFKAINKLDKLIYSVNEWERRLVGVTPYCPVCEEITEIKAKGSTVMKTHFAHLKGSNCPLIEENHSSYLLLPPSNKDDKNGDELIRWAKVNSYHLYNKCKELLEGRLKYQEFSDILEKAVEKRIWFYKGLTKESLPFVLIVNYGKFLKKTGIRKEDVHFIFDKSLYGDDLFLQKKITHVWRVRESLDIDKIDLSYDVMETAPDYFWNYVKKFTTS